MIVVVAPFIGCNKVLQRSGSDYRNAVFVLGENFLFSAARDRIDFNDVD